MKLLCPNCSTEAFYTGNIREGHPIYECLNSEMPCNGLRFALLSEHFVHIEPDCFAQFVKATWERKEGEQ